MAQFEDLDVDPLAILSVRTGKGPSPSRGLMAQWALTNSSSSPDCPRSDTTIQ
jgi:hypothetical protein